MFAERMNELISFFRKVMFPALGDYVSRPLLEVMMVGIRHRKDHSPVPGGVTLCWSASISRLSLPFHRNKQLGWKELFLLF